MQVGDSFHSEYFAVDDSDGGMNQSVAGRFVFAYSRRINGGIEPHPRAYGDIRKLRSHNK